MLDKPRQLSLQAFSWDDNNLSRLFHGSGESAGFLAAWNKHVLPFIHTASGTFSPPPIPSASSKGTIGSSTASTSEAPTVLHKGKRSSLTTPPTLMPATKRARLQQEQAATTDTSSAKEMDEEIASHSLGEFL